MVLSRVLEMFLLFQLWTQACLMLKLDRRYAVKRHAAFQSDCNSQKTCKSAGHAKAKRSAWSHGTLDGGRDAKKKKASKKVNCVSIGPRHGTPRSNLLSVWLTRSRGVWKWAGFVALNAVSQRSRVFHGSARLQSPQEQSSHANKP